MAKLRGAPASGSQHSEEILDVVANVHRYREGSVM
jgi:hypothetical protein